MQTSLTHSIGASRHRVEPGYMRSSQLRKLDNTNLLRVGVVHWFAQEENSTETLISATLEELGCETVNFLHDAKLPEDLGIIFVYGPFGSLVPLASQLLACPPTQRPLLVFQMSEQPPNPGLPECIRYSFGAMRSRLERLALVESAPGRWKVRPYLRWAVSRAHRFRYYGDLFWLQQQGILSMLVVDSPWTAEFLRRRGLNVAVSHLGSHPAWGRDLGLERDIPVLWLGKIGSKRRGKLLRRIRTELRAWGVETFVVDGIEHPYVFDEERTVLLNRTKVVLNLLRAEWDDNSMRYCLAAPNRALIVTEPTLPHSSFLPGEHLVEAPVEQIADTICYYLHHEDKRQQIADNAYHLVSTELTMHQGIARILEQVAKSNNHK